MTLLRLLLANLRSIASWNLFYGSKFSLNSNVYFARSISSTVKSRVQNDADGSSSPSSSRVEEKFQKEVSEEERRMSDLKVKALAFLPSVDESVLDEQQLAVHHAHVLALKVQVFSDHAN
jgi:hypothetical protein